MNKRKPFIVEFTGTPEAGKTTVIHLLYKQLSEMGYNVKFYPESAENAPKNFPKWCTEEKLWINFDTLKNVLEAQYLSDYDIIIFDRGTIDRTFWIYLDCVYCQDIPYQTSYLKELADNYSPDLLIAFYVSEDESIKRRGGEGRLVTKEFVSTYNRLFKTFINPLKINKVIVNTDNKSIEEVLKLVEKSILEHLKSHS